MTSKPRHAEVIFGTDIPGTQITYTDFFNRYATSEFGLHHAEQPLRYSVRYGYEREQMLEDLGDDVHPVLHSLHTERNIIIPFIAEQNTRGEETLMPIEIATVRVAGLGHDTGECTHPLIKILTNYSVGDIPWDLKTDENAFHEHAIRQVLYEKLYHDIMDETLRGYLKEADDIIDHKDGTFAREVFQTIERIGYYNTAIQAGKTAFNLLKNMTEMDELRLIQLGRLAVNVTDNHRDVLERASDRFPYVTHILEAGNELDERIHEILPAYIPPQAA